MVPKTRCIVIPDDVPFDVAALVGCAVITRFGAVVNDAAVRPGDQVAVIGVGGEGINAIAAARLAGAASIVAIDINADKAAISSEYGPTHFIKADDPEALPRVRAVTAGRGVDSTIECTGRTSAMTMAYDVTRPAGTVVIVGIAAVGATLSIPAIDFPGSKKRIVGSIYGDGIPERDILCVLSLYRQGRLDLKSQIGARTPLEQVNDALTWLESGILRRTIVAFS